VIPIGTILYGYCGGYFGRDSYEAKRVEAIGVDWIVVRNRDGDTRFANDRDIDGSVHTELAQYTEPREGDETWEW
jgi:hypothetical protein